MIAAIICQIIGPVGAVLLGLLAIFGYGAVQRRKGRVVADARHALREAEAQTKANSAAAKTLQEMVNVEVLDVDRSREWLLNRDPHTK